jgi:formate hydrogenlyase subunit 4
MIHEAMILEYSGSDLALMELSHSIKQTLLMAVLINVLMPFGLALEPGITSILLSSVLFILKAVILSVIIGIFEASFAKYRLFRLPSLFMLAFFFSFSTILFELLR